MKKIGGPLEIDGCGGRQRQEFPTSARHNRISQPLVHPTNEPVVAPHHPGRAQRTRRAVWAQHTGADAKREACWMFPEAPSFWVAPSCPECP